MQAVQLMTGQGGWPLSLFLTPDRKPFYGGTYFPPSPRWGKPGFPQLLEAIGTAWRERREELESSAAEMVAHLDTDATSTTAAAGAAPAPELVASSVRALERQFDEAEGGFGGAPKFPPAMRLELLLRHWLRTGDPAGARHGREDAREDGGRRHVRPGRRRLPPLLGGRPLARPPLREDALRQRDAREGLRPGLPRLRQRGRRPRRAGDARLPAAGDDAGGRRLLRGAGRRLRRRRRDFLRLEPGVARGGRRRRGRAHRRGAVRRHRARQLRGRRDGPLGRAQPPGARGGLRQDRGGDRRHARRGAAEDVRRAVAPRRPGHRRQAA